MLAAINQRGATTNFIAARFAAADGALRWAKAFSGGADRNNTMTVAVHNGQAIFAGRVGIAPFDPTAGDGFLMSLNAATGAYNWGSLYYTGRGVDTIVNHYVTGLVSTPGGLWAVFQGVPGSGNQHHFWGRWYQAIDDTLSLPSGDGSMRLSTLMGAAGTITPTVETPTTVVAHPFNPATDMAWTDQTASVTCDEPTRLEQMNFQAGTQVLLQRIDIH